MKKLFFVAVCMSAVLGVSAEARWTGSCGEERVTIDSEYFDTGKEAEQYYQELNEIYCGKTSEDYTISKH